MRDSASNARRNLIVVVVIGLLAMAVIFSDEIGEALAGALIVVAGSVAIAFRAELAAFQHRLAETGWVSDNWAKARPFTWLLWGGGVVLVGVSWILFAYAHV